MALKIHNTSPGSLSVPVLEIIAGKLKTFTVMLDVGGYYTVDLDALRTYPTIYTQYLQFIAAGRMTLELDGVSQTGTALENLLGDGSLATALQDVGNATKLQSRNVSATAPADGEFLKWVAGTSSWTPGAGGGGGGTTQSKARIYRSAPQAIPGSAWTKVQFNTVSYDGSNEWSGGPGYEFTPIAAGYYLIKVQLRFVIATGPFYAGAAIYIGGGRQAETGAIISDVSGDYVTVSDIQNLGVGDTVDGRAWINDLGGSALVGDRRQTFIAIHQLSTGM